ncbi:mucosa-associated lymphoid tissue lymphoma translocation protein 1 isoform X2 [Phyllopteryx taeniolatus]|uniref:mucosa-associated lymphoid tissue lymphoma translocation protein 1 isoform X2 n=1 Tax=Phyllopteryx taeniolatus TaxID=161469 RepID=UPI002AD4F634|nr:mucosa-associated lymphoid tissue lymphoma translocation protein 1 isoform X2 [Phyllopteryx taeniolatus]
MAESLERSAKLNSLKEPALKKLCDVLDRTPGKGWRRLGEIVAEERRFKIGPDDMEMCSLKVLQPDGSPSRMLLRLMGERGCTCGHLMDYLHMLGNTEALHCLKAPVLQIIIQPQSVSLLCGHNLRLSCHAVGQSPVQYQWFKSKEEVPNGSCPELAISGIHVKDGGFYICRVNCGDTFQFSQWAQVDVLDVSTSCGQNIQSLAGRLKVAVQPRPQQLLVGATLQLEGGVVGRPIPRYQWHRDGAPVPDATRRKLTIPNATQDHQGRYRCEIISGGERTWTNEVEVVIAPRTLVQISGAMECSEDDVYAIGGGSTDFLLNSIPEQLYATDKVALLIGNLSYQNHPQLKAPMVDVYDLTNVLRQLDFKVVSLLDLTESEMRNAVHQFLLLLHKGVYGLLYYAGHGYENYGNSFMVPVDAPNPYRSANCLCVQSILMLMQEKETGLNVFLLDMCRKRNFHDDSTHNVILRVTANIVFGYATCQDAEAFELSSSSFTNGVFVKFLKKRLLDDEKITVVLDRVAEDMGQFDATRGKQALEIRSSLSERRALTDPVLPGPTDLLHSQQWAKAHELPESMYLDFECGAQIKLGFAAEFSNVLVMYTHIVRKPPDLLLCQAHVTDFPQELDVDPKEMNKTTPEDTGVYLLSSSLPQHCLYTRLCSLQKLKEELVFNVCLRGATAAMDADDSVCWTESVDIGKPLIARLDLHQATRPNSCLLTCPVPHSPNRNPVARHQHQHPHLDHPPGQDHSRLAPQHRRPDIYEHEQMGACGSSIPIEASDDIDELQTAFINSLQLRHP